MRVKQMRQVGIDGERNDLSFKRSGSVEFVLGFEEEWLRYEERIEVWNFDEDDDVCSESEFE